MVECTRCGCRNDRDSRFCAACGFSLLPQLMHRATPAAGFAPNLGLWPAPGAGLGQPAMPVAVPPQADAEWNLVQRRPVHVADPAAALLPQEQALAAPLNNAYVNGPSAPIRAMTPPVGQTEPPRGMAAILMGFLVSFEGSELGRFWPLHQGRLIVGRSQTADGLDIAIDHGATSARHAQLLTSAQPSRVSVQDLGSTNGTFINDQRLPPGQAQMVAHGDRIRFGGFTVCVVLVV